MTEEADGRWRSKGGIRRLAIYFWGGGWGLEIVFVILVAQVLIYSWTTSTINKLKDSVS